MMISASKMIADRIALFGVASLVMVSVCVADRTPRTWLG